MTCSTYIPTVIGFFLYQASAVQIRALEREIKDLVTVRSSALFIFNMLYSSCILYIQQPDENEREKILAENASLKVGSIPFEQCNRLIYLLVSGRTRPNSTSQLSDKPCSKGSQTLFFSQVQKTWKTYLASGPLWCFGNRLLSASGMSFSDLLNEEPSNMITLSRENL